MGKHVFKDYGTLDMQCMYCGIKFENGTMNDDCDFVYTVTNGDANTEKIHVEKPLSRRDHFAGALLPYFLPILGLTHACQAAIKAADALIKELDKTKP